jgi:hypothetical protein
MLNEYVWAEPCVIYIYIYILLDQQTKIWEENIK